MSHNILVYIDHFKGTPVSGSFEAIGAARTLADRNGGKVIGLIIGEHVKALAEQVLQYRLDEIRVTDNPNYVDYCPEKYTNLLLCECEKVNPDFVLFPSTSRGKELAAQLGVDLDTGVIADVIEIQSNQDRIIAIRPTHSGKILTTVTCDKTPQILTLRFHAFAAEEPEESTTGVLVDITPPANVPDIPVKVVGYVEKEASNTPQGASIVTVVGRGLLSESAEVDGDFDEIERARFEKGYALVKEFSDVLGAKIGSTRPIIDSGLMSYSHQIGQTGIMVAPDLLIGIGVSGSIQFLAGIKNSKVIIGINEDPDAPIFSVSDYGMIGDLYTLLPALTKSLKERRR